MGGTQSVEVLTYKISPDGEAITCLGCGLTSYYSKDVDQHYCNHCKISHDDLYPPSREWWIKNTPKAMAKVTRDVYGIYSRITKPKYEVHVYPLPSSVWRAELTCNCGERPDRAALEAPNLDALMDGVRQALVKHEEH